MTAEADGERVWLVGREYTDKGLVELVYATPDGERMLREQRSAARLGDVTAAREVAAGKLVAVGDPVTREHYAAEAGRMADRHDPDEAV